MTQFAITEPEGVGPQRPVAGSPARARGSARRTSSIDVVRPEGAAGPVRIDARARDAVVDAGGRHAVADACRLVVELAPTQELVTIAAEPPVAGVDGLVGRSVGSGFRAAAAAAVPDDRRAAGLLYLLLDELPVATLVSGYALQRANLIPAVPRAAYRPTVDLCAGWESGATLMNVLDATGSVPMTLGPPAPPLDRPDDDDGWHALPAPARRSVRRRRRIDVTFGTTPGAPLEVDAMFRDSHFDDHRVESAVHEYGLRARVDTVTGTITACEAEAHVLPYVECPGAAPSAARLVGMRLDEVRDRVRADLVGTTTCTHLNDLLRSLEDVRGIATAYRIAVAPAP